ncbi:LacI family DNA-binding transcriptional regulator [Pontibacter mangrovi]|uniref:LacI family transcriptional regulator n=1 Tax=Pontibacter mangrovi TaxID=2589816 RepID=A0A501W6V9_9BACT|nr:LacI family DNA-binding transcriptional regulator [Pontibacter mangrovi]TPE44040.1 LacI family transcriptional regulator [Pontibacter mangrovi]
MLNKQVTIKDLARKLRLSVSTVSRALRDVQDINPETKRQVLALAKELNYEPNFIARSLVNKQTKVIGVVLPVIAARYFANALSGMMEVADANGYHIMFCQSDESPEKEASNIKKLVSIRIDGLLVSVSKCTSDTEIFQKVQQRGIPVVFFDRALEHIDATKVTVNQHEGAFLAVEHLIRKGCTKIAHIAGPRHLSIAIDRMNGYLDALQKYNIPFNKEYLLHCEDFQYDAMEKIQALFNLEEKPDAIFTVNDSIAVLCIKYLKELGIRVPEDVAVVGYNNDPVSEVVWPALTTVMQPSFEVGKLATQLLIDEIEQKSTQHFHKVLSSELIVRSSS